WVSASALVVGFDLDLLTGGTINGITKFSITLLAVALRNIYRWAQLTLVVYTILIDFCNIRLIFSPGRCFHRSAFITLEIFSATTDLGYCTF
ncbi:MAG: hypothetical protein B6D74_03890, partial [gamma proteobacterium symbiont of Ctena orbiculata]